MWIAIGAPIGLWMRPIRALGADHAWVAAAVGAGLLVSGAGHTPCSLDTTETRWTGRFEAKPRGGSARFRPDGSCGAWTVVVARDVEPPEAGVPVTVEGDVVPGRHRPWIAARSIDVADADSSHPYHMWRWWWVRWRGGRIDQVYRLFGDRAPLVAALLFARREGLDPELRDAFAAAGIAHLLAISGFHVGVLALLLGVALSAARTPYRFRAPAVTSGVWAYVVMIGAPDAACRAAMILTAVMLARMRGYPSSRWAPLALAGVAILLLDPSRIASPGAQLSFAGAAGLIAWSDSWTTQLRTELSRRTPRSRLVPDAWLSAVVVGAAATLATTPIAAWHFGRVSWVGIPVTLAATPLVSAAIPGALGALLVEPIAPGMASVLAEGAGALLGLVALGAKSVATVPWTVGWTTRPDVLALVLGGTMGMVVARSPRIGREGRRLRVALCAAAVVTAAPAVHGVTVHGSLELRLLDVGQGDAILLRTPRGRWLLFDAGPPPRGDVRGAPLLVGMRRAGVRALETLVISHADADHFGGAEAVIRHMPVRRVVDPGLSVGKAGYLALLEAARAEGVPWSTATAGDRWTVDGVEMTVWAPTDSARARLAEEIGAPDANEASLIVLVEWRGFRAILAGDAFRGAERSIADRIGDVDVLKVGHHGSDTSTDPDFLAAVRPEWAAISVGRRNRYGHPSPRVLDRLAEAGAEVVRTDRHGEIRIRVHRSGRIASWTQR